MLKITDEEVWLRAFECVMGSTVPRDGYEGDISIGQVDRATDRADELLREFRSRFRSREDEE